MHTTKGSEVRPVPLDWQHAVTEYIATWRWTGNNQEATLTYNERSLPVAIDTIRQAVSEGRITQARVIARTVIYDSSAGIDLLPD